MNIKKVSEEYIKGKITLSQASKLAGLTLWEMESFLIEQWVKSQYSIDDLEKEIKLLCK